MKVDGQAGKEGNSGKENREIENDSWEKLCNAQWVEIVRNRRIQVIEINRVPSE